MNSNALGHTRAFSAVGNKQVKAISCGIRDTSKLFSFGWFTFMFPRRCAKSFCENGDLNKH